MGRRFARLPGLRSILAVPTVYGLFTRLVGGDCFRTTYINTYVCPRAGDRILDIGCGTGEILDYLPGTEYRGIDISEAYIKAARSRYGDRGTFVCQGVGESAVDQPGTYDLALANGVLHHLDDGAALELFHLAQTVLKPGGRLVTHDGCYTPGQSRVARWLLQMDRGKYVRPEEAYPRLAGAVFSRVKVNVRHNLLRIPYTHIIMECTA